MALRDALAFVGAARDDAALGARLDALGPDATLEELVTLAASAGYVFAVDELRAAHRHDWAMRFTRRAADR